jgi:GNAT superfamily N-acetyltransferase
MKLRYHVQPGDAAKVGDLVRATGFFNEEEIGIAIELVELPGYLFVFAEDDSGLLGYTCYSAVPATRASWDLYWIAVHPRAQRGGIGRALMAATEQRIGSGAKVWVETSGRDQYRPTRAFYERCGYAIAAVLDDFYAPKDAKIIFAKAL